MQNLVLPTCAATPLSGLSSALLWLGSSFQEPHPRVAVFLESVCKLPLMDWNWIPCLIKGKVGVF